MLNIDTKSMNIFIDFYMPIFTAIYQKMPNVWYTYNPDKCEFNVKMYGKTLVMVNKENYQEVFNDRYELANKLQSAYYEELNEEIEENAKSNGKR